MVKIVTGGWNCHILSFCSTYETCLWRRSIGNLKFFTLNIICHRASNNTHPRETDYPSVKSHPPQVCMFVTVCKKEGKRRNIEAKENHKILFAYPLGRVSFFEESWISEVLAPNWHFMTGKQRFWQKTPVPTYQTHKISNIYFTLKKNERKNNIIKHMQKKHIHKRKDCAFKNNSSTSSPCYKHTHTQFFKSLWQ